MSVNFTRRMAGGLALVGTFWLAAIGPVRADGLGALEAFLRQVKSAQAEFTQTVTSPPRDGQVRGRSKTSKGRFVFARPDRFRFDYTLPFEQTIVADGKTLWLHDKDLNQVTARDQQSVLGSTPAALIASGADLGPLRKAFDLVAQGDPTGGLAWVLATPKTPDGSLQSVRLGFADGTLSVLEMNDSFGQRSVMSFSDWKNLDPVKPETFVFRPPAGADVIRP